MAHLLPDTQSYELMIIFLYDLGESEISKKISELKNFIEENGGKVTAEDVWGVRDLAYKIKKQDRGFYYVLNFNFDDRAKINELNKTLLLDNSVLRHLIIKTPSDYVFKTLKEYEIEAKEIEKLEKDVKKEEKKAKEEKTAAKKSSVKAKRAAKKTAEEKPGQPEEKTEAETQVQEEAPAVEEQSKKKPKKELDELDEKLKKIMDNPDITI